MAKDRFADIAAGGYGGKIDLLAVPAPIEYNVGECLLDDYNGQAVDTDKKISTQEELNCKLEELREQFKPFLLDYAPDIEQLTAILPLKQFVLDGKETVTIPHYGGPIGYATKVYETEIEISHLENDKAVYICFKGADYLAYVYINDECVGIHEGFFSPFEFEITEYVCKGKNKVKIVLKNDWIFRTGTDSPEGDKLYAATGLGYDDPQEGWHHCPPGMGIYNDVNVEIRNNIHITDLFVRNGKELWVEVQNSTYEGKDISFFVSIYGQNFDETIFENKEYLADDIIIDDRKRSVAKVFTLSAQKGKNVYRLPINIDNPKIWDLDTPYLYQAQVCVNVDGNKMDCKKTQFGIRDFVQDVNGEPKGMFYLNGRKVRLRGANTMGFEQQDVLRGDIDRLIDDILLAKLCNMNFFRLTQRPVQDEVYEYCDKLGLMTQTDLPLFGCMRRTKFAEGVRQAEEMERMIRNHPCNIMVSYINEPFANGNNEPHRHFVREELEGFFDACDIAIRIINPDRVIKHVDGDYDPPTKNMPDNHCYNMWYNGHGIDVGLMNKGYWMLTKPGWYFGCGEYGVEGLDSAKVMKEKYPKEWLKEPFSPQNIVRAQTWDFHRFFYDTQDSLEDWVKASQKHQYEAIKFMTEAFRRNSMMVSFAIHLFIDAWPSGWMKAIMDCERIPKPAYFAYRDAIAPIIVSLRTDRYTYYEGEKVNLEAYVCNDTNEDLDGLTIVYELFDDKNLIAKSETSTFVKACDVNRADDAVFIAPSVDDRHKYTLKAILKDGNGKVVNFNEIKIEVFKDVEIKKNPDVELIEVLKPGEYIIAGEKVIVRNCEMNPVHFVSRKTGHNIVNGFEENDFKYWYDANENLITPLLRTTFEAEGFTPILVSGRKSDNNGKEEWIDALAVGEKYYNGKRYVISQLDLRLENPIAKRFLKKLYEQ